MMLAAGNPNPEVRTTRRQARRSRGEITVEARIDQEPELLREIRRNRGDELSGLQTRSLPGRHTHICSRAGAHEPAGILLAPAASPISRPPRKRSGPANSSPPLGSKGPGAER